MSKKGLLRLICLLVGLALMGYSLTLKRYDAWLLLLLVAILFGALSTRFLLEKVPAAVWIRWKKRCVLLANNAHRPLLVASFTFCLIVLHLVWHYCLNGELPHPITSDEQAYLISAEAFVQGRWTNPTPAGWEHFEAIHVTMIPSYHGKYQPGMAILLAIGKIIFQHFYAGVVIGLLLASLASDWMFRQWLPHRWSLLASLITATVLVNNFHNYLVGGTLSAAAGAVLLGTMRQVLDRGTRWHHGFLLGSSFALFFWTRPFEGSVLSSGVCLYATVSLLRAGRWRELVWPLITVCLLVMVPVVCLQLRYNEACVGSPWKLPYSVHESQYGMAPLFLWQSPRQDIPAYRHNELLRFHQTYLADYDWQVSGKRIPDHFCFRLGEVIVWYHLPLWLAFLSTIPELLSNRWSRFALILLAFFILSLNTITFLVHHYIAPSLTLISYLLVMSLRYLRTGTEQWGIKSRWLVLGLLLSWIFIAGIKVHFAARMQMFDDIHERQSLQQQLEATGQQHLLFVEHAIDRPPADDWVFNSADLSKQQILWARSMTNEKNRELINNYPGRRVWLLKVNKNGYELLPYPVE